MTLIDPVPLPEKWQEWSKSHICDVVSFTICGAQGYHKGKYDNAACYAATRGKIGVMRIECRQVTTKNLLSKKDFSRWIKLCRKYRLIPDCVETFVEGRKYFMTLPVSDKYDKVGGFSALCCFRWADYWGQMVWQLLRHVEEGVYFWQALHYGSARFLTNCNHNVMWVDKNHYSDPLWVNTSVAAKAYYHWPEVRVGLRDIGFANDVKQFAGKLPDMRVKHIRFLLETDLKPLYKIKLRRAPTEKRSQRMRQLFERALKRHKNAL